VATQANPQDVPESTDVEWRRATAAVIHAQINYATLLAREPVDDDEVTAAWLRLWKAEVRQRRASAELDGPVS
jgi:hypothetical protein